jgi:hypothetical protein
MEVMLVVMVFLLDSDTMKEQLLDWIFPSYTFPVNPEVYDFLSLNQ